MDVLILSRLQFAAATYFSTPLYNNYFKNPLLFFIVIVTVLALLGTRMFLGSQAFWKAWFSSAVTIMGATFFGIIGLYPTLFPSSLNPAYSLTAHNASSSPLTLKIMLVVTLIFVPIVLIYQIWAYNLFKGKISQEELKYEEAY